MQCTTVSVGNLWNCGLGNAESNLWKWNCRRLLIGQVSTPCDVTFSANYRTKSCVLKAKSTIYKHTTGL